jgi:Protein of unknown function (DUF3987)
MVITYYQIAWQDFQATIEVQLRPDGKLASCQGWGGKICGFALRIAGLLHVVEYGENNLMLGEATMRNALTVVDALVEHAITALGSWGLIKQQKMPRQYLVG